MRCKPPGTSSSAAASRPTPPARGIPAMSTPTEPRGRRRRIAPPYHDHPSRRRSGRGTTRTRSGAEPPTLGAELTPGRRIVGLDLTERRGRRTTDESYAYDRCSSPPADDRGGSRSAGRRHLLPNPRRLPAPARARRRRRHFIVIGAGFIGSEIAAALAINGSPVKTARFPSRRSARASFPRRPVGRRSSTTTATVASTACPARRERHRAARRRRPETLGDGRALDADADRRRNRNRPERGELAEGQGCRSRTESSVPTPRPRR